ncbi:MAG: hypothetical protein M1831_002931 [Alyxoria varia]|nr:MAG: hypothetical protein M1831_002931 [Alyxoria varia]
MGQSNSQPSQQQEQPADPLPAFQAASEKPIPFRYHEYDMTIGHCDNVEYFDPPREALGLMRGDIKEDTIPQTKPAYCVAYMKNREQDAGLWICQDRKGEPKKPSEEDLVVAGGEMITNCAYDYAAGGYERPFYGGTWPAGNKEDGIFILVDKLSANYT